MKPTIFLICWLIAANTGIVLISYYWLHWSFYMTVPNALIAITISVTAVWYTRSLNNKK